MSDSKGFTLIEVLIAMAILVFISFGIYQATTNTFRLRDSLTNESDFFNGIRFSMDVLNRDITMLYSPLMMIPPKQGSTTPNPNQTPGSPNAPNPAATEAAFLQGDLAQTSLYWGPAIDSLGIRPSHFVGKEDSMTFVAASNIRIYKDSRESDFAKVAYSLEKDTDTGSMPDSYILIKKQSADVFEEDEKKDQNRKSYPLLRGIKKLKYRYYRRDKEQWVNSWDSDSQDTKNQYPDIVEIQLQVIGPTNLSFDGNYKFRPEVPLHAIDPSM